MHVTEIFNYRDGGTTAFSVILSVLEQEKLNPTSMPVIISIDSGTNGDGQWYIGLKNQHGTVIEDTWIKQSLATALAEKIQRETLVLENIKQFI